VLHHRRQYLEDGPSDMRSKSRRGVRADSGALRAEDGRLHGCWNGLSISSAVSERKAKD